MNTARNTRHRSLARSIALGATLTAAASADPCYAGAVCVLTTAHGQGADSWVWSGEPNTNFGDLDYIYVKYAPGNSSLNRKGYLRFDLSALAGAVTDAALYLTVSMNNGGLLQPNDPQNFTFEVFGLSDGHEGEAWDESLITWNNAPANANLNSLLTGPGQAVFLGTFSIDTQSLGTTVLALSGDNLVNFLNADSNGLVTFILRRVGHSGTSNANHSNSAFASKEHAELSPPTLALTVDGGVNCLPGDLNGAATLCSVISTFDTDTEGWHKLPGSDAGSFVEWVASGGNPGGYMRYNEVGAGFVDFVSAPAAFLGDKSAYYGGTLSFDIKTNTLSNPTNFNDQVRLVGGGITLRFQLPNPSPVNQWHHRSMELTETAGWIIDQTGLPPTQAEMLAVLSDVTALLLLTDYRNGPEQVCFDNISLTLPDCPTPGDLNGDGVVNVFDLLELLAAWGPCPDCPAQPCPADLDDDCTVNVFDLLILLANWG